MRRLSGCDSTGILLFFVACLPIASLSSDIFKGLSDGRGSRRHEQQWSHRHKRSQIDDLGEVLKTIKEYEACNVKGVSIDSEGDLVVVFSPNCRKESQSMEDESTEAQYLWDFPHWGLPHWGFPRSEDCFSQILVQIYRKWDQPDTLPRACCRTQSFYFEQLCESNWHKTTVRPSTTIRPSQTTTRKSVLPD